MTSWRAVSLLALVLLSLVLHGADEMRYHGKMGYLTDGMQYLRDKDTRLAFGLWIDELAEKESIDVSIKYYDDADEVIQGFEAFRFDMLAVNPIFYLRHYEAIHEIDRDYWIVQKGPHAYEKMVLLVRRDSGIAALSDLKGKTVVMRDDHYMGRLFLDKILLEAEGRPYNGYIGELDFVKKHSRAILNTFFRKNDACVVPLYVLELISEMNPALKRDLTILVESPRIFMPIVSVFHIRTPDALIEAYARNVRSLEQTARGQNILDLFKMKGLVRITRRDLEPIRRYYEAYLALKRQYEKGDE